MQPTNPTWWAGVEERFVRLSDHPSHGTEEYDMSLHSFAQGFSLGDFDSVRLLAYTYHP